MVEGHVLNGVEVRVLFRAIPKTLTDLWVFLILLANSLQAFAVHSKLPVLRFALRIWRKAMANAAQVLQQAHDLIEAGDYQSARQILDAVRSSNENNPDFWWIYAHAVEDATEGKAALERVRQLAPNYTGLESLVGGTSQPSSTIKPLRPLSPPPPLVEKVAVEEDDFADTAEESPTKATPFKTILTWLALALFIIVLVIYLVSMALNNTGGNGTATPERTAIVDNFVTPVLIPTSESQGLDLTESVEASPEVPVLTEELETEEAATATEEAVETEAVATATEEEAVETEESATATEDSETVIGEETEAVASADVSEAMEEIADFGVPEDGVTEESSSLGQTLVVTTCSIPGPNATSNILGILDAFKAANVSLDAVEAIAFDISDCANDTVLLSIGISSDIVESYWLGDTTASELFAAFRRL
jgi:hypothetical protein